MEWISSPGLTLLGSSPSWHCSGIPPPRASSSISVEKPSTQVLPMWVAGVRMAQTSGLGPACTHIPMMRPGPQNLHSHAPPCPVATQQPPGQPRLLTLAHTYSEPRRLSPQLLVHFFHGGTAVHLRGASMSSSLKLCFVDTMAIRKEFDFCIYTVLCFLCWYCLSLGRALIYSRVGSRLLTSASPALELGARCHSMY